MRVNELIEKRKKAFEDAKEFVKTHENENGVLSAEDKATYEKMEIEIAKISDAIEREKRAESMEKELSKAVTTPIVEKPEDSKPVEVKDTKPVKVTALTEYKEEVLRALRSRKPIVSNYLQEGIDTSGGYLVPEEMDREIIKKLAEENVFRKLAKTINTSGEYKINIAADKPTAAWIEEGEALVFSDPTFNQIKLDAHKLSVAVKVTEELLADNAFDLEGYLIEEFARALANAEEDAFLNGNGEGKPVGIDLPVRITRTVTYCEPGVKGDTSGKSMKPATLDTGIEVRVPLFINTDDKIVIDSRDGSFLERAKD